jgi:hypothetical protein
MIITLNIDTSSSQAKAFIEFIKTLDFIKIDDKDSDENFALSVKQKKILDQRKQKHLTHESKSFQWEDIKKELSKTSK